MQTVPLGSIQIFTNVSSASFPSKQVREAWSNKVAGAFENEIKEDEILQKNITITSWSSRPGCIVTVIYVAAFVGGGAMSYAGYKRMYPEIKARITSIGRSLKTLRPDQGQGEELIKSSCILRCDIKEKEDLLRAMRDFSEMEVSITRQRNSGERSRGENVVKKGGE